MAEVAATAEAEEPFPFGGDSTSWLPVVRPAASEEQGHGWEVVATSSAAYDDDDDSCSVFPPSRHEGLQPLPHPDPDPDHDPEPNPIPVAALATPWDREPGGSLTEPSSSTRHVEEGEAGELTRSWSWRRPVADSAKRAVESGLELVQLKLSVLRGGGGGGGWCEGGAVWSFAALAGVVGALLYVRRRHRREKELLLLLIQEKDQRISQLMNQLAQMNELVAMRYQVPVLRRI